MHVLKLLLLLLFRPRAVLRLMHHRPTASRPKAEMRKKDISKERDRTDHIG
jgi:hypothetical protein